MKRNVLNVVECCNWCRKPTDHCAISCDDAGTYSGVLIQGEWRDLDAPAAASTSSPVRHGLTAA